MLDIDPAGKLHPLLCAAARHRPSVLGAVLRDTGGDSRRAVFRLAPSVGNVADRGDAGAAIRRHGCAPAMGTHDHQRRSSVAVEVGNLVAAGITASEPDRAARVAVRARGFARRASRATASSASSRPTEDADQQLSVGALHRSRAGLSIARRPSSELDKRPLSPDSAYVVMPEVGGGDRARSDRSGKMSRRRQLHSVLDQDGFRAQPGADDIRSSVAENAVANPGLEDGNDRAVVDQWHEDCDQYRARAQWRLQPGENGAGTAYQDVNGLEPGETYTVSAWVSGTPGSPTTAQLRSTTPATTVTNFVAGNSTTSPAWRQLSR